MITGTPTIIATSEPTSAALSGTPDDQFKDGDFAYVAAGKTTWRLDRASSATVSATVLATFTGNGRWVLFQPMGSVLSVASYAELDALDASTLSQGTRVNFVPQHANWYLRLGVPTSTNTDEVRVALTGATPAKYWERIISGSTEWYASRLDDDGVVYVDGDNGSDDALGDSDHPLKSLDEFVRRTMDIVLFDDVEIDVFGAKVALSYPFAPKGYETTSVLVYGSVTTVGTSVITASTAFNRATNAVQEYTATVAGQPLTAYLPVPQTAVYYLSTDAGSGWIAGAAAGASVYAQTYSGSIRGGAAPGAQIQIQSIDTYIDDDITVDATNCFVQFSNIGFNGRVDAFATVADQEVDFFACAFTFRRLYIEGTAFVSRCYIAALELKNSQPSIDACSIGSLNQAANCSLKTTGSPNFTAPSFYGAINMRGGALSMTDVLVKSNGISYDLQACNLLFLDYAWGPNTGGANGTFILRGSGTFVSCADFTKIYATGAGGGQRLAQLLSASGTATNIADQAALTGSGTGIRNSNAFIGFVN